MALDVIKQFLQLLSFISAADSTSLEMRPKDVIKSKNYNSVNYKFKRSKTNFKSMLEVRSNIPLGFRFTAELNNKTSPANYAKVILDDIVVNSNHQHVL